MWRRRAFAAAGVLGAVGAVAARRARAARGERAEIWWDDGSMVSLPGSSEAGARVVGLALEALRAGR